MVTASNGGRVMTNSSREIKAENGDELVAAVRTMNRRVGHACQRERKVSGGLQLSFTARVCFAARKNGSGARVRWARWAVGLELGQMVGCSIFFCLNFFFQIYFLF